jgi:hypothetical protein
VSDNLNFARFKRRYSHQLQKKGEIEILQTKSCDNLTDLFTKSLPTILFLKYVFGNRYETTQRFARIRGRHSFDINLYIII